MATPATGHKVFPDQLCLQGQPSVHAAKEESQAYLEKYSQEASGDRVTQDVQGERVP